MWTDLTGRARIKAGDVTSDVNELLSVLVRQFGGHVRYLFDEMDDVPYAYNESQMHSVMLPAFNDVCEVVFREQPLERRPREAGEVGGYGQLDYWLERKGALYLLEYKHSHYSIRAKTLHTWARDEWAAGQRQLRTLLDHAAAELLDDGQPATIILLMTLRHYWKGTKSLSRAESWDIHEELVAQINRHPETEHQIRWHGLWRAPSDMRSLDYDQGPYYMPAVSFVAAVSHLDARRERA